MKQTPNQRHQNHAQTELEAADHKTTRSTRTDKELDRDRVQESDPTNQTECLVSCPVQKRGFLFSRSRARGRQPAGAPLNRRRSRLHATSLFCMYSILIYALPF